MLSTAQILRGKLERADKRLPRDVFDIAKAAARAPAALESAVNAVSAERAEQIAPRLVLERRGHREQSAAETTWGAREGTRRPQ